MTTQIIVGICCLLLIAYLFDLSSGKTRIPSVILLLLLGFVVRRVVDSLDMPLPNLFNLLPIFGTVGLILIVLEGSLELEFNPGKMPMIKRSMFVAVISIFVIAFILAFAINRIEGFDFRMAMVNVIPLAIISSAIAIPTASMLDKDNKEFVIFESSISDIVGVLFFNFLTANAVINAASFGNFFLQLGIMIVVSLGATLLLSLILSKLNHHIKFMPIIILTVLVYEIAKIFHLPALLFILCFGLFLGNLEFFAQNRRVGKWIQKLHPEKLDKEVKMFKDIAIEATFIIRTLFFILFGFLLEADEILNPDTIIWATGICALIYITRIIYLKIVNQPVLPLVFIAPRGLITILLFIAIAPEMQIYTVNKSLIVQVILITALVMMAGMLLNKKEKI